MASLPSQYSVPCTHRLHASYAHPLLRQWASLADAGASPLAASDLVYPIFVHDKANEVAEIKALPEQFRWGVNKLEGFLAPLVALGLRSVILFGVPTAEGTKDAKASFATSPESPVALALQLLRKRFPSLLLMVDVCLCAYTDTGHCGVMRADDPRALDNQASIDRIAEMAVFLAQCGAQVVAPSDMMDGRIGAIKLGLARAGLDSKVSVMSYAAKFASVFYGPFRDAAGSGAKFGDRSGYQLPPASRGLAIKAVQRDIEEGADFLMVKPGTPYLDIVRDVRVTAPTTPVAIYHVSGEYAMLWHAAAAGAFGLVEAVRESLMGAKRAGASILLTYYTPLLLKSMREQQDKERVDALAESQPQ